MQPCPPLDRSVQVYVRLFRYPLDLALLILAEPSPGSVFAPLDKNHFTPHNLTIPTGRSTRASPKEEKDT